MDRCKTIKEVIQEWNTDYQSQIDDMRAGNLQYADIIDLHEKSLLDLRDRIDNLITSLGYNNNESKKY